MEEVRARRVVGLVVSACLGFAPAAFADPGKPTVDEAKIHFKTGAELYDENNFRGALVEFQRAYDLAPSYRILYNIGQVDMELADYAGALIAYKRYLREGGPDVPADRQSEIKGEIGRLEGRVGHIIVQTQAGTEVLVDDLSVGFAPLPEPLVVNTGRHKLTARPPNQLPVDRVVDVAGQQELTIAVANDAPVGTVARVEAPKGPPSQAPKYVALGATVAFAAAAATSGYLAHLAQDRLTTLRDSFPVTQPELSAEESKETRDAYISDAFTAAAVISAGISLYYYLRHPANKERLGASVSPAGALVFTRF